MNIDLSTIDTRDKFAELMLYIAKSCAGDPNFGATRLNKSLYFADFFSYRYSGKSISGASYMRLAKGPVPKALIPVQNKLVENREAAIEPRTVAGGYTQNRLVALREPDMTCFTAEEIALVEQVLKALDGKSAKDVSDLSHGRVWAIAGDREEIPYNTVFLSEAPLTPHEVNRGLTLAKEHGWNVFA